MKKKVFSVFLAAVLVVCMSVSLLSVSAGASDEADSLPTVIADYLEEMRSSASWAPVTFTFPDVERVFNWQEMKTFHTFSEETQAMIALGMYGQLTEDELAGLDGDAAAFLDAVAGRIKTPTGEKFCLTVAPYVNYLMQTNFHIVLTPKEDGKADNSDGLVVCRTDSGFTVEKLQTEIDICTRKLSQTAAPTPAPTGAPTAPPPVEPSASAPATADPPPVEPSASAPATTDAPHPSSGPSTTESPI